MSETGWVWDERFLRHDTGEGHPERPARLAAIDAEMRRRGLLDRVVRIPIAPAEIESIALIHDREYIRRIEETCARGERFIDTVDSAICSESYEIALLAAGGVLAACDAVMAGGVRNAFCAVRPPGHHAERDRSMGFCLFNNIAIAARHLQRRHGLERVLILDWDVHHGNGTQHSFEDDGSVFFCSIHEHPASCYPGTGHPAERGRDAGLGTTLNLAMPAGTTDDDYQTALTEHFLPAAQSFDPDFVLVSAGFDGHARDPLAAIDLTDDGFTWLGRMGLELATEACGGRLIAVLEGGYDLEALSSNVANVVELLLGDGAGT